MNFSTIKNSIEIGLLLLVCVICILLSAQKIQQNNSRFDNKLEFTNRWLEFNNTNVDHVERSEVIRGSVENLVKQEQSASFDISLSTDKVSENAHFDILSTNPIGQIVRVVPIDNSTVPDGTYGNPFKSSKIDFGHETSLTFQEFLDKIENGKIVSLSFVNKDIYSPNNSIQRLAIIAFSE